MKRSKHSLSYKHITTTSVMDLVPIGCTEVLPGDTIQHATSLLVRAAPMLAPVMATVGIKVHHWFVPNRLVWDDWEDFITGGPDGQDASVFPTINFAVPPFAGSLANYLGVPLQNAAGAVSALPFRAYQLIWNEWYRDQDLATEAPISTASGADSTTSVLLQQAAWDKDYFSTCRPWPQKGPELTIPLGSSAPVNYNATPTTPNLVRVAATDALAASQELAVNSNGELCNVGSSQHYALDPNGRLVTDLSSATAGTINELRLAFALQRYEEARARYGSRYTEYLRYLGVRSSDARLQRPEYLGGGKQVMQFSEVLQTSPGAWDEEELPTANMAGHGIGAMRSNRYRRFFEEHGFVISLLSIRPQAVYGQGLQRFWNKRTKEDFWQRELEHIGQQEVLNKETYVAGNSTDEDTFGFQDRYEEYRTGISRVSGEMATLLDYWNMARLFDTTPDLGPTFLYATEVGRCFAGGTAQFYVMAHHSMQARRLISRNSNPHVF